MHRSYKPKIKIIMKLRHLIFIIYGGVMAGSSTLLFYACNKTDLLDQSNSAFFLNHEDQSLLSTSTIFNKAVGAPIDGDLGKQWIRNYNSSNPDRMEYFISMKALEDLLIKKACVGICMYYANNDRGDLIVLPVGINEKGAAMIPIYIQTQEGEIDWPTAQKWMNNYKGTIKAHFFGSNTFDRLKNEPYLQVVRASAALDDKGVPQLLLSNAAQSDPSVFQDASRPCPPYCPISESNR